MYKIALFASGSGTNVENIARYFKNHPTIEVALVLSNKNDAFVLERAKKLGIPNLVFNRQQFYESNHVVKLLFDYDIDLVVLAGFLWLIPASLIDAFPRKILNIHPALLPKYGGKGMYGGKVHQAVVDNYEKESGITIHFVNDKYDDGEILFQAKCPVINSDTPQTVAEKVHALEYEHFPKVIEKYLLAKPIQ
jgi:phosphoribosylglycinamide formyltransferase-1